jgi:8-oxo-dGTP diphosphatase
VPCSKRAAERQGSGARAGAVATGGAGKCDGAPVIHVVAGAVIDEAGRVLIAQRPPGKHLAGGWEFPGGKLEPGEARAAGLARELREELGIAIRNPRPLIRVRHTYPYGEVLIDMWVVKSYSGEPRGLDGQALKWLSQENLERAELLPADGPIVRALRLPERLTHLSTPDYEVVESTFPRKRLGVGQDANEHSRPVGMFCRDGEDAADAAGAGADFLALSTVLGCGELVALCDAVAVPVFVRGIGLDQAWALGASGCNEIGL